MDQSKKKPKIRDRKEPFVDRSATRIWKEIPNIDNPYIAKQCYCYGYDILELAQKQSFSDVIFLLLQGNLPSKEQSQLFESFLICMINPGPRHSATRAAMNAGVGKTNSAHILPIGLSVLGGDYLGSTGVSLAMTFMKRNHNANPTELAQKYVSASSQPKSGDWHIAPGFGTYYGQIDTHQQSIISSIKTSSASGKFIAWGEKFSNALKTVSAGWLSTGVAAAVLLDLGFHPRMGAGLFQLACGAGILAHGLEFSNQPRTAMPFISDDNYTIEYEK